MSEHHNVIAMEQMRAHLARAERELEATQRFLDPQTRYEAELDVVGAVANARLFVRAMRWRRSGR